MGLGDVLVLGDKNYSVKNIREEEPFSAPTTFLTRSLVTQAGIKEENVEFHNVFDGDYFMERKWKGQYSTSYEFSTTFFKKEKELKDLILRRAPSVVVVTHELPFFLLTEEWNIDKFRGTLVESTLVKGLKVIPTYHPTRLNKQYIMKAPCLMDFRKAKKLARIEGFPKDERVLIVDPPFQEFMKFCDKLIMDDSITEIAYDIETLQPGTHISWMGLSSSPKHAVAFKLLHNRLPTLTLQNEVLLWDKLYDVFNCGKPIIAQNGVYDSSVILLHHGFFPKLSFDTMVAAHAIWPQLKRNLGFLSSMLLDVRAWKHTSTQDMGLYNAMDVANTHGLYYEFKELLKENDVEKIFEFEMRQCEISSFLGLNGITIDVLVKEKMEKDYNEKLDDIEESLFKLIGKKYNWASTKQMCTILYEEFKLPKQFTRVKTGKNKGKMSVTSENTSLKKLLRGRKEKRHKDFIKLLLKHREASQMLTTFLSFDIEPETNKVYTSYNITGTQEGRWSSSQSIIKCFGSGNLQNQPKEARKMYLPNV